MRRSIIGALAFWLASACARGPSTLTLPVEPAVIRSSAAGAFKTLYVFAGGKDGSDPQAGLVAYNGVLYGTTLGGDTPTDFGTVYRITTSGNEKPIYAFKGSIQGYFPTAPMVVANGRLYGITPVGGIGGCRSGEGCGTVFSITPSGDYNVLYAFTGSPDGSDPVGPPLAYNGALWGLTAGGGKNGKGALYRIDLSTRTGRVWYSFKGGSDGAKPLGGLTLLGNLLYGLTNGGGGPKNYGTIFSVTTGGASGVESVVYRFGGGNDGANPFIENMVVKGSVLYGTTYQGGGTGCVTKYTGPGCGTIFSIDTGTFAETVEYRFLQSTGASPFAGLTLMNGRLFGAAEFGANALCGGLGCGTIFSYDPSQRSYRTLHVFEGTANGGVNPASTLVSLNGVLYGTTAAGPGFGTVFSLQP